MRQTVADIGLSGEEEKWEMVLAIPKIYVKWNYVFQIKWRHGLANEVKLSRCLNLTLDNLPMSSIYYTYILKCNDGSKYYGHTSNLRKRLNEHAEGGVSFTRNKQPELVYYEKFSSRSEAFKREMQFKNGKTREETIEKLISSFPKANCQGFNSQTLKIKKQSSYNLCRPCGLHKLSAH